MVTGLRAYTASQQYAEHGRTPTGEVLPLYSRSSIPAKASLASSGNILRDFGHGHASNINRPSKSRNRVQPSPARITIGSNDYS